MGLAGEPGAPGLPGPLGDMGPTGPEAVMPVSILTLEQGHDMCYFLIKTRKQGYYQRDFISNVCNVL